MTDAARARGAASRRGASSRRASPTALAAARTAALLAVAVTLAACDPAPDRVAVGGKFFTEQDILGEITATWIERTTDLQVRRRLHLGGTFLCHRALLEGQLDLYVEYTGTALTAILEEPVRRDPDEVFEIVRSAYRERFDLEWTEPLGFENTFAILVRRATADSLGLETVTDLVPHAGALVPGMGYEFVEREDGLAGLVETYGLEFGRRPRTMELGLLYPALSRGRVDVVAGNSTDGQIDALDLVILEDDRRYFPPYEAAPVVRAETLERHPELRDALNRLGGRIDTREMRRMNREVDARGRDYREVAREWVERELGAAGGRDPVPAAAARQPPRARGSGPVAAPQLSSRASITGPGSQ